MSKFSIKANMLNNLSKIEDKNNTVNAMEGFTIEYINIEEIIPNPKNFYDICDIEDLSEDIKLNGLNHNLVVKKCEDKYRIISGERRYTALKKLVNENLEQFKLVPCKVINVDEVDEEIILIQANARSRELNENEKLRQVERLTELYKLKKKNGEKVPGRVVELVGKDLGLSKTQVSRYTGINQKLIDPLKKFIKEEKLSIANASEISSLSEDSQQVFVEIIEKNINLNKKEAIEMKNKLKEIEIEKEKEKQQLDREIEKIEKEREQDKQTLEEILKQKKELELKIKEEEQNNNKNNIEKLQLEKEKLEQEKERLEQEKERLEQEKENEKLEIQRREREKIEKEYERKLELLKTSIENKKKIVENENSIKLDIIKANVLLVEKIGDLNNKIGKFMDQFENMNKSNIEIDEVSIEELEKLKKNISQLERFINTKSR